MCSPIPWATWTMPRAGPQLSQRLQAICKPSLLVNWKSCLLLLDIFKNSPPTSHPVLAPDFPRRWVIRVPSFLLMQRQCQSLEGSKLMSLQCDSERELCRESTLSKIRHRLRQIATIGRTAQTQISKTAGASSINPPAKCTPRNAFRNHAFPILDTRHSFLVLREN